MRHRRIGPALLAGLVGVILLLGHGPAVAEGGYPPGPKGPVTGPQIVVFTPVQPTAVSAAPAPVRQSQPLARTGGDVARWTIMALGLVGIGSALYVTARRRPQPRT